MPLFRGLPFDSATSEIQPVFLCSSCHYLLVEPKVLSCGHRYCTNCLKQILGANQTTCIAHECGQIITNDQIHRDFGMEHDLKSLTDIVCHNKANGCRWIGDYLSYKDHFKTCSFQRLECEFCSALITNRTLYNEHYETCPKVFVACPLSKLGCDVQIPRETLHDHVLSFLPHHLQLLADHKINSSQPLSVPSVLFDNLNNKSLEDRISKQNHLIEQLHTEQKSLKSILNKRESDLQRACVNIQLLKGELCDLRKEFQLSKTYVHNDGTFLWNVENIQELFFNAKNDSQATYVTSPLFYTSKYGYKLSLKLYINGDKTVQNTHLSLYVTVMRGEYDSLLKWPFSYPVTLCLYDRSAKQDHVVHTLTPDVNSECFQRPTMNANRSGGIPEFCPLWKVFDKEYGYVYQQKMFIKAFVDFNIYPPSIWPQWTKLQTEGLPINIEHIKLKELLNKSI